MKKLLFVLIVFFSIAMTSEGASALRELQAGMAVPDFSLSNPAGKNFPYQELAGQKGTLLIFWQTSTINSQKALRQLESRYAEWRKQGLQILAVNVEEQNITDEDLKKIKSFSEGLSFPIFVDFGLTLFDKLGIIAMPTMILIDDKMVINKEMSGFPLVGSQLFVEEVGYFLGEKRVVAKEVYQPVKQAMLSYQMGLRLEKRKDYDKAIDLYEKALKADPKYVNPAVRLMELYLSLKRPDEAKALPAKIDKSILDNPVIMMSIGKLHYHEKDATKAGKMFAESLMREETPDAYVYSGFISYDEGRREESERFFNQAVTLSNRSPEVLNKIGRYFAGKSEYAKANGYYKQALEEIFKAGGK
jgi:Tfp pilus assembly protein PilF/peroxiredoxin